MSKELLARITQNRDNIIAGKTNYIPLPKDFGVFSDWYPGTMRGEYVGITGGTSSAKTTVTKAIYLFDSITWAIKNKKNLRIKWFGLEESRREMEYSLLSWLLMKTSNRQLRYNIEHFEAIGKTIHDHDLPAIEKIMPIFEQFLTYIDYEDNLYTTEEMLDSVLTMAATRGTFTTKTGTTIPYTRGMKVEGYTPSDPEEFVIVVIDHMALVEPSEKQPRDDRKVILGASRMLRNICCKMLNYISVAVVQQMAAMEDLDHIKERMVYASLQGLGDAKTIARDMHTVLGITNTDRFGDKLEYVSTHQYNIGSNGQIDASIYRTHGYSRTFEILKRRFGKVGLRSMLCFDGCTGYFKGISSDKELEQWVDSLPYLPQGYLLSEV